MPEETNALMYDTRHYVYSYGRPYVAKKSQAGEVANQDVSHHDRLEKRPKYMMVRSMVDGG